MNDVTSPKSEPIDRIPGDPAATAWRQSARRHQSTIRELAGWPAGRVTIPRTDPKRTRPIGSRVDLEFAKQTGCNFLTTHILAAVDHRVAAKEHHQMLDETRLRCDLLSSMPMCFNLFGPLWNNQELAEVVIGRWFPELAIPGAPVSIHFEWSPGRRDRGYLGDRTAFDVMIRIGKGSERHEIGIETKYHEYPAVTKHDVRRGMPDRYEAVTLKADLFGCSNWRELIWGTAMEQVWRDHLLALANAQHDDGPATARYILVAPSGNPAWRPLVDSYRSLINDAVQQTVEYRSVEQLLAAAEDILPHARRFRSRYLDVTTSTPR